MIGGAGADVLLGDIGIDTVSYATSSAGVQMSLASGDGLGGDAQGDNINEFENLIGSAFGDELGGDDGANILSGLAGADELDGGSGSDLLDGGAGGDVLTGGFGADTFDFNSVAHSRASAVDSIGDFVEGLDKIDLATIDANRGAAGDQAFSFIGTNGFSGTAGELRFEVAGILTTVQGDVNGDSMADLQIVLFDPTALSAGDFNL